MKRTWMPAALIVLCLVAFGGVWRNGFVRLDDTVYITENPMVADGLTPRGISWAFTTTRAANWHPLTWLSHQLDVELFGVRAGPHHLVSLLLHAASAVVAFRVLLLLGGAAWPAFLAAALFATHPLRVESVAWAAERKDVLALLLALSALLAWIGWVRRRSLGRLALASALFALALLAKPTPVTLPFALLLLDWWPLGRWAPGASFMTGGSPAPGGALPPAALWREKIPFFALAAAASAVTWLAQSGGGAATGLAVLTLEARFANAAIAYVRYLALTIWPAGLSVLYPHPAGMPAAAHLAAAVLVLAALSVLALRGSRRRPWFAVGWLWYLGTLVPMIGLVQVGAQALADRYTYLPHLGLLFAAAWATARCAGSPGRRVLAAAASCAAVALCVAVTSVQVGYWRSSLTLADRALATLAAGAWPRLPGSADAAFRRGPAGAQLHNLRGLALEDEGRFAEATAAYRVAEALYPHHAETQNNLARALERAGRTAEAIGRYERAAAIAPRNAALRVNLAAALIRQGEAGRAAALLREAIALDPADADARNNLGVALATLGEGAAAERAFRDALALLPGQREALDNLAHLLRTTGREAEAAALVRVAPGAAAP